MLQLLALENLSSLSKTNETSQEGLHSQREGFLIVDEVAVEAAPFAPASSIST